MEEGFIAREGEFWEVVLLLMEWFMFAVMLVTLMSGRKTEPLGGVTYRAYRILSVQNLGLRGEIHTEGDRDLLEPVLEII